MRWLGLSASAFLVTACAHAVASNSIPADSSTPSAPATRPARGEPAPEAAGRAKADLLRDTDFRVAFEDLQRLRIALDFGEVKFGLLRVTLGPGFTTVSSARYNLERLYMTYRVASYRSEDTFIELWRDGSMIGEVTAGGVVIGAESGAPR
jgi:hypothetical protein